MPVVPLGIETYSSFRIINDGYENCNLKYQFIDDVAEINVKLNFSEGSNIGITRQKLKVDLSWKGKVWYVSEFGFRISDKFKDNSKLRFSLTNKYTSKIDKHEFMETWTRLLIDGTYTTKSMNELFDLTKSRRISDEMTTKQILLYVNKLLKPYEICIRPYRGKSNTIL